jgi:hypothetical protein
MNCSHPRIPISSIVSRKDYFHARKVFILGDGLVDFVAGHTFEAGGVRQAETAFSNLAAPENRRLMQAGIHPFNRAAREQVVEKSFHRVPTEAALHQRPGFVDDVVRGNW